MRKTKFKGWNYTGYADEAFTGLNIANYKTIDFFKGSIVASMKTTKFKKGSDWLNAISGNNKYNQKHIVDFLDGLEVGKFYQNSNKTGKVIDKISTGELHIFVPDMTGVVASEWQTAIKNFAKSRGYSDLIINKLSVKISTIQSNL